MTTAREQARAAVRPLTDNMGVNRLKAECSDAASDVWAKDYEALAELLADETIAPLKRIATALVWIKEALG